MHLQELAKMSLEGDYDTTAMLYRNYDDIVKRLVVLLTQDKWAAVSIPC